MEISIHDALPPCEGHASRRDASEEFPHHGHREARDFCRLCRHVGSWLSLFFAIRFPGQSVVAWDEGFANPAHKVPQSLVTGSLAALNSGPLCRVSPSGKRGSARWIACALSATLGCQLSGGYGPG